MNCFIFATPDRRGRIDAGWVERTRAIVPGRWCAAPGSAETAGLEPLSVDGASPAAVRAAAGQSDDWCLIVRAGLELPADFNTRVHQALSTPDCPDVIVPVGNYHPAVNPWEGSAPENANSLVAACGYGQFFALSEIPDGCVVAKNNAGALTAAVLDTLYVHDPDGGDTPADPRVALGHLRLSVQGLLNEEVTELPPITRDGRPVTLHISHNWGGGIARWITDFIAGDSGGHHLVLAACSDYENQRYGQSLKLLAAGPDRGCIREWRLSPVIADTAPAHDQYRDALNTIIARYGVGRIMISSLIGHSLDALRTGLPTLAVLHDFYPVWPLLEHDPLTFVDANGHVDLECALATHGDTLRFGARDAGYWRELACAWRGAIAEHDVKLVAPSQSVIERWKKLDGALMDIQRIPHGFSGWSDAPEIQPAAHPDGRLRLVVVGRMQEGKGLGLLKAALPELKRHAHITLVGTGHGGKALFGASGVNIVYHYEHTDLPALLARIKPQAALFLSTVAETWNYTLSELRSLGLVPIATGLGSFAERIADGIDGVLISPEPKALNEAIATLQADPQKLAALREGLPAERTLVQMVADYDALLPARPQTPAPPAIASETTLEQTALAGRVAESEQLARGLAREHQRMAAELKQRTRWAETMERQFCERSRWAEQLEANRKEMAADLEERTRWARQLDERIKILDERIVKGEHQREELERKRAELDNRLGAAVRQIEALEAERERIFASRSWRITRPLRVAVRMSRNARAQQWWKPSRWPRRLSILFHHLRLRGFKNTLWLLQQEDSASVAPMPEVPLPPPAEPDAPLLPVVLPAAEQPLVSIIIPVYNQVRLTRACLQSIVAAAVSVPFEVIVVDDESSDETPEFLFACEGVKVITQPQNGGFIRSCNTGAARARGRFVVFLNNDTTVSDGWLDALIRTFSDFPRAGIVGARLIFPDGRLQEAGGIVFNDASGWNYGRGNQPDRPEYQFACETDYVSGACLAIPKTLFEELNGFDAHFAPAYYEDTDLCFRARKAGYQVTYQPECVVVHHEGATSGTDESTGTKRYQAVNRKKFRKRWREVLTAHPAPVPGEWAVSQVWRARHHRNRGRILIIDALTPQPDHDSGSMRMRAIIELCLEAGWRVTFAPENLAWAGEYTLALRRLGAETLHAPQVTDLEPWLEAHGAELDWVILSRHYVAADLLPLIKRLVPDAKVVFDTVDLHFLREEREAELIGSSAIRRRAATSRKQELRLIAECNHTLVVSTFEQKLLNELDPSADIRVLSNIHTVHGRNNDWIARKDLLFVGGFQHPPNVDAALWLAEEIFPYIRAELPQIRLHLIGSRMPPDIAGLQVQGIKVHGFVPDLEPFLNGCRLSLAPLRYGAGVKGKVNQAMSYGLPVVATTCAAEGMFLEPGQDVLVADDAEDFARQVIVAYNDLALWTRLSDGALANVEKYFSRAAAESVIRELLSAHD